jgi:MFS family permease
MILFGLSAGAILQAGMYLTAQYCGQKRFGTIFGAKSSLTALGIGSGPLLSGVIVDTFGSYELLFVIAAPLSLVAVLLVYKLGPFPDWSQQQHQTDGDGGPDAPSVQKG